MLKKVNILKDEINGVEKVLTLKESVEVLLELLSQDPSLEKDLDREVEQLISTLDKEELKTFMSGQYDNHSAILHVHAGAGGKDASNWAEILERMYLRWANNSNFTVTQLDRLDSDEGGIKYSIFSVEGPYVYGRLKCEQGIHRLVRISPFDSNSRRHTSFASLNVVPQIEDEDEFVIDEKELKVETFRSSGAGGQHVNTTDSAVRITHIPTNTSSSCSSGRSQLKNRESAMKILKSRLLKLELKRKEDELKAISGESKDISWGNQIRSYVFHPYKMVKDHRTSFETSNVDSVMDGEIDDFIDSCLRKGI